jgi:signal peptidase I
MSTSDTLSPAAAPVDAPKKGGAREAWDLFKTVAYALLIALVLRVVLFQPFTIPSASMEPNLYEGDYIIVSKFAYGWSRHSLPFSPPLFSGRIGQRGPDRGDVVVFKLPNDDKVDYIKRLIGLPGDRIQVKDGLLYLNGREVPRAAAGRGPAYCNGETYTTDVARFRETLPNGKSYVTNDCSPATGDADNTAVYTVPAGCYFMMGDNRDNSLDSRFDPGLIPQGSASCAWDSSVDEHVGSQNGVGFVPAENLEGKADLILFSWSKGASLFKPWTWVMNARPSRWLHLLK